MKLVLTSIVVGLILVTPQFLLAQKKRSTVQKISSAAKSREIGSIAYVIDETLSVLRREPSLFAEPVQRMRRGRKVQILGLTEADGVKFYKVAAPPSSSG